jgi:hypothetical protein
MTPELEARLRLAQVLGSARDRTSARVRLGLTVADVAALTGLSPAQVRTRETDEWKMTRGSLDTDPSWRYVEFVAYARGLEGLLLEPLEGVA